MSTTRAALPAPPADWAGVYRRLVIRDLAFDFRVGFAIEYYRTFSTPSMARVLAAHGEMLRNPKKRSYDTALILMEIINGGFDSARGQAALADPHPRARSRHRDR